MSITVTYSETRILQKVSLIWISDGSGNASGVTKKLSGKVLRAVFIPSIIDVPTEGYTVKILDADGVDILVGYGLAGLSATITRSVVPMELNTAGTPAFPFSIDGALTITISGGGNIKSGTVSLYIER